MTRGAQNTDMESCRSQIESALKAVRVRAVQDLILFLKLSKGPAAGALATQLQSQTLDEEGGSLRKAIFSQIIKPDNETDPAVMELRGIVGWDDKMTSFEGLCPQFLDVVYLLPPRLEVFCDTLVPVVTQLRSLRSEKHADTKLLDIGVGTGLLASILDEMEILPETYVGIDPANNLADFASSRKFRNSQEIAIHCDTIEDFQEGDDEDSKYDIVVSHMVFHHILSTENYKRALVRVSELLAEGGIFVYTDKVYSGEDLKKPLVEKKQVTRGVEPPENDPFVPHPEGLIEAKRHWIADVTDALFDAKLHLTSGYPVNYRVATYTCSHGPPNLHSIWLQFVNGQKLNEILKIDKLKKAWSGRINAPYQWLFDCLPAFFEDLTGRVSPQNHYSPYFARGIAYFSWEPDSRIFLVRRAVPFPFHILSYSHVHDGWGVLGEMVDQFEKNPRSYMEKQGYTCLTDDSVQRTLPFLGDIQTLNYTSAIAIPVYNRDSYELIGAFLIYLHRHEHSPASLTDESQLQKNLVNKCQTISEMMVEAVRWQEDYLGISNSAEQICTKWRSLVKEELEREKILREKLEREKIVREKLDREELDREELEDIRKKRQLVVVELTLELKKEENPASGRVLRNVASRIQSELSSGDSFSVIEQVEEKAGAKEATADSATEIRILIAGRKGISSEELRTRVLKTIGPAGEARGAIAFECRDLHEVLAGSQPQPAPSL